MTPDLIYDGAGGVDDAGTGQPPSLRYVPASNSFPVVSFGAKGDGSTDDTAAVQAAMDAAYAAGGGWVSFEAKTYRIDGQLSFPGTADFTSFVCLAGAGSRKNGVESTTPVTGGTVLDLRYQGADGKILASCHGSYGIRDLHMTQTIGAGDTTPFLFSTHSTPHIENVSVAGHSTLALTTCTQDGFVFGSTGGSGDSPSWFAGYGGYVRAVTFDRIRSGIVGRKAFNAFLCDGVTFTNQCGSNNTQGAVDLDGTGDQTTGNCFLNTCIEVCGYPYAIRLKAANLNNFYNTGFWDYGGTLLYLVKLEGGSFANSFLGCVFASVPEGQWVTGGSAYMMQGEGKFYRVGVGMSWPEDKLHLYGANAAGNTAFSGGGMGAVLQNSVDSNGVFTSIINKNYDGVMNAGIFFKNVDQTNAGALHFSTRAADGSAAVRQVIDENGKLIAGSSVTPASGALSTLNSTTQGFAPPRMTQVQRDAIASPAEGLIVYNTTTHTLDCYAGAAWQRLDNSVGSRRAVSAQSDFFVAGTAGAFVGGAVNGGSTTASGAPVSANHPGVVKLRSTTTNNSGYVYHAGISHIVGGDEVFEAVFKTGADLSTLKAWLGLHDATFNTAPGYGAYIDCDGAALTGKTVNGATADTSGTSYTISTNTWYRVVMVVDSAAARVDFYLYSEAGALLWTDFLTTKIPTATAVGAVVDAISTAASTLELIHLDYCAFGCSRTLTR